MNLRPLTPIKKIFLLCCYITSLYFYSTVAVAATTQGLNNAPQPTPCLITTFSKTGNEYWSNVVVKVTNTCGKSVDIRNLTITFNNASDLNTSFWASDLGAISYPDNQLQATSQPNGGNYLVSMPFHVPDQSWANSILANGASISLQYGITTAGYDAGSAKVYVNGQAIQTGNISLLNNTKQPSDVTAIPTIDVLDADGRLVQKVSAPWKDTATPAKISVAPGVYTIRPNTIIISEIKSYQGKATPAQVTVNENKEVTSTIAYTQNLQNGKINVQVPAVPIQLAGYSTLPVIEITSSVSGSVIKPALPWNKTTTIIQLAENVNYHFATTAINYNNAKCTPTFTPATVTSSRTTPQKTQLSYTCQSIQQVNVNMNVGGAPATTETIDITFTPNDGTTQIKKTIDLLNGVGFDRIKLTNGVIYNIAATNIADYDAAITPTSLTAAANANVNIIYNKQVAGSGKRIIGYLPGWLGNISPESLASSPYSAEKLSAAGYTHVSVAFGLFSTTNPGEIATGAFDCTGCVTPQYVDSLHAKGIKVLLSIGGASTGVPNTSVDFHQMLTGQDPEKFKNKFVQSVKSIMNQYHFDGIDIDIEHGFGPKVAGSASEFVNPASGSDIDVMAKILNQLHNDIPKIIISLAPQTANMSPNTNAFDGTWSNYSSLIMQTYKAIDWVGIQLYNTGCTLGLDTKCYANTGKDADYSVAMAATLLEDWPAKNASGQLTGFMPYVSHLRPDQVVLGYPAPDAGGVSDGAPALAASNIKQAVQCLRTGETGCYTYKAPRAYPGLGGVFEWSLQYDLGNQYKFASDLKACVINNNCN